MAEAITIKATAVREVFKNVESDFYIYGMDVAEDCSQLVTKNKFGNISLQTDLEIDLYKELDMDVIELPDANYEGTYRLISIKYTLPTTPFDQSEYIKALVTPLQYQAIYDVYNRNKDMVATLILEDNFDYTNVHNIGSEVIKRIKQNLEERVDMNELITFLQPYDVSMNTISKIHKHYGDSKRAIKKIQENPYNLLEVSGIGFLRADAIAMEFDLDPESEERIMNGLFYIIHEQVFAVGDTYTTQKYIVSKLASLLDITKAKINKVFSKENLENYHIDFLDDGKVTTSAMKKAENFIKDSIMTTRSESKLLMPEEKVTEFIEWFSEEGGITLSDEQESFLYTVNKSNVNFLVGGGGVGKTFTVSIIGKMIDWYRENYSKYIRMELCAPTGRASKIMSQYVGREAKTIHRLAKINSNVTDEGNTGEYENPLRNMTPEYTEYLRSIDIIIIDESSMIDVPLAYKLLSVLDINKTKVLFIGDDYQIPSVGAGNVLYDCLNSGNPNVNVTRLTKVYRIKEGGLATVAKQIRDEEQFLSYADSGRKVFGKDLVFNMIDDKPAILENIVSTYSNLLDRGNSIHDIMVLSPTKKGDLGVKNINDLIQAEMNPLDFDGVEMVVGKGDREIRYRIGDKVMNEVNAYSLPVTNENFDVEYDKVTVEGETSEEVEEQLKACDVFNGELGTVINMNSDGTKMVVEFDDNMVLYDVADTNKYLNLGYASTIHKAQGGQASYVICVFDKAHTYQLNANLIYTGLTRTQKACLVFTQAKTMIGSLKKFVNTSRNTRLIELLSEDC